MKVSCLNMPTAADWLAKKNDPEFCDARDVGFIDAHRGGWYRSDSQELYKGFKVTSEDYVVDIGCGAGGATLFCARQLAHVDYCDLSTKNIAKVNEALKYIDGARGQGWVTSCEPIPLAENYATRVVAMEVLEHVENPGALLAEMVRVGRRGALYLITVPDGQSERIQKDFAPKYYYESPNHINIFDKEELKELVESSGLKILSQSSYGFFWNIWVCMYWVLAREAGMDLEGESYDIVQPPYFQLLDDWSAVWGNMLKLPGFEVLRRKLDNVFPKSQIVLAVKQ